MDSAETFILRERCDERRHRTIRFAVVVSAISLVVLTYQCQRSISQRQAQREAFELRKADLAVERAPYDVYQAELALELAPHETRRAELAMQEQAAEAERAHQERQAEQERHVQCLLALQPEECEHVFGSASTQAQRIADAAQAERIAAQVERAYLDCRNGGSGPEYCARIAKDTSETLKKAFAR